MTKNSMSDPGTTYRTREEVQRMRSTQDPIRGLQRYIEEWGGATDAELKASNPQHFFLTNIKRAYIRPSTRLPRKWLTKLLRRLRSRLSHDLRTSGPTSTTRALSHRLCADVSVRRCVLIRKSNPEQPTC